ncbi:response regulator [Paenibacillus antri]|uniref:Response regulator n=1 Tax=Paenibacillus antri TaxID=2582848 RepID=A0A5R9FZV9_9BACL|nr:response regulator [Paenibacillus antri]TLS49051.1 response regulator [Paenibacillus antri]
MYNVLVVDDEPMIRRGLTKILESGGFGLEDIRSAENGVEALEQIRAFPPDFLFTDIRMAKMDGLELCGVVSREYPHIQIVIVTGYDDFAYARQGIACGVKEYLLKPITKKSIQEVVVRLLDAERKRERSLPSLAKSTAWIDAMEEAVWSLSEDDVARGIESLFGELRGKGLSTHQQTAIVADLCELLARKLNARDVYPLETSFRKESVAGSEDARARLVEFAASAMDALRTKRKGKAKDPIEEAKKFVELHLSRDFSLEEVADMLGLNASYFSQLFKQSTGETFASYRIRRRMERAKRLLAEPRHRITDISYEVGYADHPHFTKTFKKMTGDTPKQFREKLGIDS